MMKDAGFASSWDSFVHGRFHCVSQSVQCQLHQLFTTKDTPNAQARQEMLERVKYRADTITW
jgi:hypothetical protein